MIKNDISFSFVGVLSTPIERIPNFDNSFCQNLFGIPAETQGFFTQEGFVIAVNNKPIPVVVVNANKIVIRATKETLAEITEKIKQELEKYKISMALYAFGMNCEIEYIDLEDDSRSWLWNRFIKDDINPNSKFKLCDSLKFNLTQDDDSILNVVIEPRVGKRNGIFIGINHHHNITLSSIPEKDDIERFIEDTSSVVGCTLNNLIGE